jgi:hypothetical protein
VQVSLPEHAVPWFGATSGHDGGPCTFEHVHFVGPTMHGPSAHWSHTHSVSPYVQTSFIGVQTVTPFDGSVDGQAPEGGGEHVPSAAMGIHCPPLHWTRVRQAGTGESP